MNSIFGAGPANSLILETLYANTGVLVDPGQPDDFLSELAACLELNDATTVFQTLRELLELGIPGITERDSGEESVTILAQSIILFDAAEKILALDKDTLEEDKELATLAENLRQLSNFGKEKMEIILEMRKERTLLPQTASFLIKKLLGSVSRILERTVSSYIEIDQPAWY